MNRKSLSLLRLFIREQVARNMHTIDTSPNTFEDFQDYEINIVHDIVNDSYMLTVLYKGKKLGNMGSYPEHDEANHQARMIIDKHRVQVMDGSAKEI
tara:strand:+ start:3067 stop:3357 length:291 start_codon:yes stop_codon:yes gene_type:complete